MQYLVRYKWVIVAAGAVIVVVAFLAFRPDKIFVDDSVDESLSDAFATTAVVTDEVPATTTTLSATTTSATNESTIPDTTTTTIPSGPIAVSSGEFTGIDHAAEGTATVYTQTESTVLRFEDDTDIQNGPDLFVWLLADDDYDGGTPTDYIDLGKIKGNVGGQNYNLTPKFDPDVHKYVLVWCKRFATPFAGAPLELLS